MRDYTIVTDSTCDLTPDLIERYNLKVASLYVLLDGHTYKNYPDEREITNKELYAAMRNKKLPTTSAVNPQDFTDIFRPELEAGRDILYVGFSSPMSCTYNSGCTVAAELREEFPEAKILTVDSLAATFSLGLLAILAAKKKEVQALNAQVSKMVKSSAKKPRTEIDEKLDKQFSANKGKLPWPVDGVVTETFGKHYHPVYKNVELPFNNGLQQRP